MSKVYPLTADEVRKALGPQAYKLRGRFVGNEKEYKRDRVRNWRVNEPPQPSSITSKPKRPVLGKDWV